MVLVKLKVIYMVQNIVLVNEFSKQKKNVCLKNPVNQYGGPDTKRRFAKISIQ